MPDPQIDAAAFWSRAALMPKGADGQTLPMPSLGYSLPNDCGSPARRDEEALKLSSHLQTVGLGHTRAAQALLRSGASAERRTI